MLGVDALTYCVLAIPRMIPNTIKTGLWGEGNVKVLMSHYFLLIFVCRTFKK
jgi:hypothetical protein